MTFYLGGRFWWSWWWTWNLRDSAHWWTNDCPWISPKSFRYSYMIGCKILVVIFNIDHIRLLFKWGLLKLFGQRNKDVFTERNAWLLCDTTWFIIHTIIVLAYWQKTFFMIVLIPYGERKSICEKKNTHNHTRTLYYLWKNNFQSYKNSASVRRLYFKVGKNIILHILYHYVRWSETASAVELLESLTLIQ